MMQESEAPLSAYELERQRRQAHEEARFALVERAVAAFVAQNPTFGWQVSRGSYDGKPNHQLYLMRQSILSDLPEATVVIVAHPGGYKRNGRMVFYTPTTRQVEFGPNDWDTVRVSGIEGTEITVSEDKDPAVIAKEVQRRLNAVAHRVTDALNAEQRRMRDQRNKGAAVVQQFRDAGWYVSVPERGSNNRATAYVPDEHPLRKTLGISSIHIDLTTGGMAYSHPPYLPSGTTAADLAALTAVQG